MVDWNKIMIDFVGISELIAKTINGKLERWLLEQIKLVEGRNDFTANELSAMGYQIVIPDYYNQDIFNGFEYHLYKGKQKLAELRIDGKNNS